MNPPKQKCDAVLLDDDMLVHMMWKLAAKHAGKLLLTFTSIGELRANLSSISTTTPIFLDSDLGTQSRGEDIALELRSLGFEELYIVTGYESDRFSHLPWLKGILGKEAPWKQ